MRYIKKLPFSYPDLADLVGSQTIPTNMEEFIANISRPDGSPAIRFWMQPGNQYYGKSGTFDAWRDIGSGELFFLESGISIVQSSAINSKPTIKLDGAVAFLPQGSTLLDNNTELTFISVFKPSGADTSNVFLLGPNSGSAITAGAPSIYLTPTGISTRIGGEGSLIHTAPDYLSNTAKIMTVTLSPVYGTSIRRNGVEVARDAARISPLSSTALRLYGQPGAAARPRGDTGHVLVFGKDLSSPEYKGQLEKVENDLLAFYGITKGA